MFLSGAYVKVSARIEIEVIGDPTIADALLDRLVHNAHKIKLKGESMRKRKAALTQKEEPSKVGNDQRRLTAPTGVASSIITGGQLHRDTQSVTKILFYLNQEFSESSKKDKKAQGTRQKSKIMQNP